MRSRVSSTRYWEDKVGQYVLLKRFNHQPCNLLSWLTLYLVEPRLTLYLVDHLDGCRTQSSIIARLEEMEIAERPYVQESGTYDRAAGATVIERAAVERS